MRECRFSRSRISLSIYFFLRKMNVRNNIIVRLEFMFHGTVIRFNRGECAVLTVLRLVALFVIFFDNTYLWPTVTAI